MGKKHPAGRLTQVDKFQRMIAVAELYYSPDPFTEDEIAAKLSLSKNTIRQIRKEALRHKIIDFRINRTPIEEIRQQLMDRFQLTDARLAPYVTSTEVTRELIAVEAAKYFNEVAQDCKSVGISGGRTLHQMVDYVGMNPRNLKIYPLTGLWRDLRINYVDSGALVHYLWMKCQGVAEGFWLPMEPIPPNTPRDQVKARRETYIENPEIQLTYRAAQHVDLALIGLAPLRRESSTIRQLQNIGITFDYLESQGAVGIAGGVWFNNRAEPVLHDDYFLSVPLSTFREMVRDGRKAVVIAGGEEKVRPIRVFLENHVCNVLVTDARTATLLLE